MKQKIINMILDNSRISQAMMADELNISIRAVKKKHEGIDGDETD